MGVADVRRALRLFIAGADAAWVSRWRKVFLVGGYRGLYRAMPQAVRDAVALSNFRLWLLDNPLWRPMTADEDVSMRSRARTKGRAAVTMTDVLSMDDTALDGVRGVIISDGWNACAARYGVSRCTLRRWLGKNPRWRPLTDDDRRAKSEGTCRRRWADIDSRRAVGGRISAALGRPAVRRRMSAARKDLWSDPAFRAKMLAAQKAGATEASNLRRSESLKSYCSDPEVRTHKADILRARYADPEAAGRMWGVVYRVLDRLPADYAARLPDEFMRMGADCLAPYFPDFDLSDPKVRGAVVRAVRAATGLQLSTYAYTSYGERHVVSLARSLGFDAGPVNISSSPVHRQLDCYVPSLGVAFEYNGLYWHSFAAKRIRSKPGRTGRFRHADLTSDCLAAGVRLYHLWEDWPEPLVDSIVRSKLGAVGRVYGARSLQVRDVPPAEARAFFARSHAEGDPHTLSWSWGLYDGGELVSCVAMRRAGVGAADNARFATLPGVRVMGGFSRLFSRAVRDLRALGIRRVVTYCDRDLSPDPQATVYAKAGFRLEPGMTLGMTYVVTRNIGRFKRWTRYNRRTFQKSRLPALFPGVVDPADCAPDSGVPEWLILERMGIYQVWNSGVWRYTYML